VKSMMGIECPTGSHIPTLTAAIEALTPGSLVIEHGAGLYSTPLLANLRKDIRVACYEAHPGWSEWARWVYSMSGRPVAVVASYKRLVSQLPEASVLFVDGPALERGPLVRSALHAKVPTIICHDTHQGDWAAYELKEEYFTWGGYSVRHFAEDTYRTTLWTRTP